MMLPLVVCTYDSNGRIHIAPAWGVYSVHLSVWCLAIPRFFDEQYSSSRFLCACKTSHHWGTGEGVKENRTVDSKFKDIYIGRIIQQKVDERGMSYAEFARQIHCARTSLYTIFNSKSIDIERLLLISDVLQYDFISNVYLGRRKTGDASQPYIQLPLTSKGIDTSHLPDELVEWLKKHLS